MMVLVGSFKFDFEKVKLILFTKTDDKYTLSVSFFNDKNFKNQSSPILMFLMLLKLFQTSVQHSNSNVQFQNIQINTQLLSYFFIISVIYHCKQLSQSSPWTKVVNCVGTKKTN